MSAQPPPGAAGGLPPGKRSPHGRAPVRLAPKAGVAAQPAEVMMMLNQLFLMKTKYIIISRVEQHEKAKTWDQFALRLLFVFCLHVLAAARNTNW